MILSRLVGVAVPNPAIADSTAAKLPKTLSPIVQLPPDVYTVSVLVVQNPASEADAGTTKTSIKNATVVRYFIPCSFVTVLLSLLSSV